jgi:hypothetical protein
MMVQEYYIHGINFSDNKIRFMSSEQNYKLCVR